LFAQGERIGGKQLRLCCRPWKAKRAERHRNDFRIGPLSAMAATITILERPIERIRETCEMMGRADRFNRALPELETYLEGKVAAGEISETRLTFEGLCFLRQLFTRL
jgi:hypothetical protein